MTARNERIARAAFAAVAAAITGLVIVSGYHPCDGIGRLGVLPFVAGGIALVASAPSIRPRALLAPGAVAVAVLGVAMGLDYSSSGMADPGAGQCEPVEGAAGFLLAFIFAGGFALVGVLIAASLAAVVQRAVGWRARSQRNAG